MGLSFNWKPFRGLCIVVPTNEKHVIVLLVVESCHQFFVVTLAPIQIKSMFKSIPILALNTVELRDVHIWVLFKHVTDEWFAASLYCKMLDNLAATAGQAEN